MMLAPSLFLVSLLLLQPNNTLQSPVPPRKAVTAPPAQHAINSPERLPPLYDFINNRPLSSRSRPSRKELETLNRYIESFGSQPEVKRINLDNDRHQVAEELQALRGNLVDSKWNVKMTATMKDYLKMKKVDKSLYDTVRAKNYQRKRAGVLQRGKAKIEAMSPEDFQVMRRQRAEDQRKINKRKSQMKQKVDSSFSSSQEAFYEAMDRLLGERQLDALDVQRKAELLRTTHFKATYDYRVALETYLAIKGYSSNDIATAMSESRRAKNNECSAKIAKFKRGCRKSTATTTSTASASLSSDNIHQESAPVHRIDTKKSTVDTFEDKPWWDDAF